MVGSSVFSSPSTALSVYFFCLTVLSLMFKGDCKVADAYEDVWMN